MKPLLFSTVCAAILAGGAAVALADEPTQEPAGTPTIGQTLHDQEVLGQRPYEHPQLHKGARGTPEEESGMQQPSQNQAQVPAAQPQPGTDSQSAAMSSPTRTRTSGRMDDKGAATAALNDLQANGYTQFSNFRREGGNFAATVQTQDGQTANVLIDPATGTVSHAD